MMDRPNFEAWWEEHGQYGRAGGGEYEKTFAYNAWVSQAERIRVLREALLVAQTALAELPHAQSAGANWYTRGASGLYQQVAMWVRKGREAIGAALEATK